MKERCSFCGAPLPDDPESTPNLYVHANRGEIMLQLHTECIQEVIDGLELGQKVTTC